MNTPYRIKLVGKIESGQRKPGLLTWLVLAAILVAASFLPVIGFLALVVLIAFFLPVAIGSFLGWLFGGVKDEIKAAWRTNRAKRICQ